MNLKKSKRLAFYILNEGIVWMVWCERNNVIFNNK
jgi:hypothetical protein